MIIKASPPIFSSLDVYGHNSATHWACGCHLKCPFCHNWEIADFFKTRKADCIETTGKKFYNGIKKYMSFIGLWKYVEYIHLTGGEPLLTLAKSDVKSMVELAESDGKKVSINSSLMLHPKKAEVLLDVHHVAFDIKVPPTVLTGLGKKAIDLLDFYIQNVRTIVDTGVQTEVRVPVSTITEPEEVTSLLTEIDRKFDIIIVFPLINKGTNIHPRDPEWSYYKMKIPPEEEEEWKKVLNPFARKAVVRNYFA